MLAERHAGPILSLKLALASDAKDYSVEQIELQSDGMRHRIQAARKDRTICAVLSSDFVFYVNHLLERLTAATMVFTDPEAKYVSPKLTLRSVQLVSSVRAEDLTMVVLRFMDVVGDVQQILRGAATPTTAESRSIAVDAIENVVGRSYDVARVYEQFLGFSEPSSGFEDCTREILVKRKELLFRLNLLQRAVSPAEKRVHHSPKAIRNDAVFNEFTKALPV